MFKNIRQIKANNDGAFHLGGVVFIALAYHVLTSQEVRKALVSLNDDYFNSTFTADDLSISFAVFAMLFYVFGIEVLFPAWRKIKHRAFQVAPFLAIIQKVCSVLPKKLGVDWLGISLYILVGLTTIALFALIAYTPIFILSKVAV